jgi:sialic acid synthase SpsE
LGLVIYIGIIFKNGLAENMQIGSRTIDEATPAYIIAEAGVNHHGSAETARQMIGVAKNSGVDAIKFQSFVTSELILAGVRKAQYQMETTDVGQSQYQMLKSLELDRAFLEKILESCKEIDIEFLCTPYDLPSLQMLREFNVSAIKVASTDTTNVLFLEQIAASGKPVILSTGMSYLYEIEQAYHCLKEHGCKALAILKCTSNYPTDIEEVNLRGITRLKAMFSDAVIGFSDHTESIGASPYAVAMGAKIIEKHFTLDKQMPGPDHKASLAPDELHAWVREIRRVESMLGEAQLGPTESEEETKKVLQKHLVTKQNISSGTTLDRFNITAKRTGGTGIPASMAYDVLGKRVHIALPADSVINWSDLEV